MFLLCDFFIVVQSHNFLRPHIRNPFSLRHRLCNLFFSVSFFCIIYFPYWRCARASVCVCVCVCVRACARARACVFRNNTLYTSYIPACACRFAMLTSNYYDESGEINRRKGIDPNKGEKKLCADPSSGSIL